MTVADAAMPSQQAVRGAVADIAALTQEADIKPPAITVIGAVAGFAPTGWSAGIPPALLGQVELTVSYSSKKGVPLVKPEDQNWSLTIF